MAEMPGDDKGHAMKRLLIVCGIFLAAGTASAGMAVFTPIKSTFFVIWAHQTEDVMVADKNLRCSISNGGFPIVQGEIALPAGSKISCKYADLIAE